MSIALHVKTTILPGGKLEVVSPQFPEGETVEVFVVFEEAHRGESRPSAREVLKAAPGHRLFRTAQDVEAYLREERSAWD